MRKVTSTGGTAIEEGEFYWYRVTSFLTGATFAINGQSFVADCLEGNARPLSSGRPWTRLDLSGTITVEVGNDPAEEYPGTVSLGLNNATGTAAPNVTVQIGGPDGNGILRAPTVSAPNIAAVAPIGMMVEGYDGTSPRLLRVDSTGTVQVAIFGLPNGSGFGVQAFGSSVAPAAGATVVTTTPAAANYDITVDYYVGTGAVAAEANNMQLKVNGVLIATLPLPPVANAMNKVTFKRINVPGAITVSALANATAAVPYNALITALAVT